MNLPANRRIDQTTNGGLKTMKKLMFSLFAAMMLIGVQAMAQDANN